jgi:hypothetical protein
LFLPLLRRKTRDFGKFRFRCISCEDSEVVLNLVVLVVQDNAAGTRSRSSSTKTRLFAVKGLQNDRRRCARRFSRIWPIGPLRACARLGKGRLHRCDPDGGETGSVGHPWAEAIDCKLASLQLIGDGASEASSSGQP